MEHNYKTFISNPNGARACDDCRTRKIKCRATDTSCESCEKRGVACTFVNPILKRGPKSRNKIPDNNPNPSDSGSNTSKYDAPGMNIVPPTSRAEIQAPVTALPSQPVPNQTNNSGNGLPFVPSLSLPQIIVKADEFGSLNITIDAKGNKMANYFLCIKDEANKTKYNPVSSTSLLKHPLSYLDENSCHTHQVLGLLTSQQIYITVIFFTYVFPHYPTLDLKQFDMQLRRPMTTSLLFLLNCICAIACPYGSNAKARFDKTQFYHKALELNYYNRNSQDHANWKYGHILLKLIK